MKNDTKILSVFPLFLAMLYFSSTAYANHFEINIEQNGNSYDLKAPIKVPKQDILQDTDDSLIYKIDEMAILTSDNGDSYSVDGIVDSRIITEEASSVTGITDYQVDLSSATKMEGDDEGMLDDLYSFFSNKVYADSNNTSSNEIWDSTISVKLKMTVHWRKYDSGHMNITKVTGGYTISDRTVSVTDSKVFVTQGQWSESQTRTYRPGTKSSWGYSTGLSKVANHGWTTPKSVEYTAYLKRNQSTWSVELYSAL